MKNLLLLLLNFAIYGCSKDNAQSYESDTPWNVKPWLMEIKKTTGPCGEKCSGLLYKALWKKRTVYETGVRSGSVMLCNSIAIVYDEEGNKLFHSGTNEYTEYLEQTYDKSRKLIWGCHLLN